MNTVNVNDAVTAFSTTLTESRTVLIAQLESLDQQRADLAKGLAQIDRISAALAGKPMPAETPSAKSAPRTRKPMSEAGRANIAAALQARSKRLAEAKAAVGDTVTGPAAVPSAASETQSEPTAEATQTSAPVAAKKSAKGKTDANR